MMNERTTRYASILMTLMLVVSMSVAFAGAGAADTNGDDDLVDLEDGERYWMGQTLEYSADDMENAEIVEGDDGDFVTELSVEDDTVEIDTESLDDTQYVLEYDYDDEGTDAEGEVEFEISEQSLEVIPEDSQVLNADGDDSDTDFEVDSNRADFYFNVSSDDLDGDELEDVFEGADDSTDDTVELASDDLAADFEDMDAGEYEFHFDVNDSNAEDTASVLVNDVGDAVVTFEDSTPSVVEGDLAELTFEFENTQSADVVLGDEDDDVSYEVEFEVEDTADEGNVTVVFDTAAAGQDGEESVYVHEDSEGDVTVDYETDIDGFTLLPDSYGMSISVDDSEVDLGTLTITDRSTSEVVTTHVLPGADSVSEFDDFEDAPHGDTVAEGDQVAFGFEMNGIYSFFDEDYDLSEDSVDANNYGLYVTIEGPDETFYSGPSEVPVDEGELFVDAEEEQFFLLFDVDDVSEIEVDETYDVELTLDEENAYIDDEDDVENASTQFHTEERETEFTGMNDDGVIEYEQSDEIHVVAETNAAEGTEDSYVFRMTGDAPSISEEDVVVADGEFNGTVDAEGLEVGDEFTVELRSETGQEDAVIVEAEEPELSEYNVTVNVENEDGVAVEDAYLTVGDYEDTTDSMTVLLEEGEYTASAVADGYEVAEETVDVDGEDVELTLVLEEEDVEEPEEYELEVSTVDEDGEVVDAEVTVDGETVDSPATFTLEDGDYSVVASADGYDEASEDVSLDADQDVELTMVEEEEDDDGTDDEGVDDETDDVPGFGIAVALAALLGAAFVAIRRNN